MKYKYWFSTGPVEIEIGNEWMSLLEELDKKSWQVEYWDQKKNAHYDALEYEPLHMGANDIVIESMFDGSEAFEYAKSKISEQNMEILLRRGVNGETNKSIGDSMGLTKECIGDHYNRNVKYFRKYYSDGVWINSPANIDFPGIGKVQSIPYKLTPDQVVEIRALRALCCSLSYIAQKVGVNRNQVDMCLNENPVMETICPGCGKIIKQAYRKKMHSYCSYRCYIRLYKKSYGKEITINPSCSSRIVLSKKQIRIMQYYKQNRVSYKCIREKTGIPLRVITAYFLTNPLPFTICKYCGNKIMGQGPRNTIRVFCSQKCMDGYHNHEFYARTYWNIELYPPRKIAEPDALEKAIDMREAGFSVPKIKRETGLTKEDVKDLFRYDV